MKKRIFRLLVAEDDEGDIGLLQHALETARPPVELLIARDGQEALDLLRKQGEDPPDLVLLDLNMPGMDGRQFLKELRADERYGLIPVVVFTTSEAEPDLLAAYRGGANAFVTKPVGLDAFTESVGTIVKFWLGLASLPPTYAKR